MVNLASVEPGARYYPRISSIIDPRPIINFIAIENPADQFVRRAGGGEARARRSARGRGAEPAGSARVAAACRAPWPRRAAPADRSDRPRPPPERSPSPTPTPPLGKVSGEPRAVPFLDPRPLPPSRSYVANVVGVDDGCCNPGRTPYGRLFLNY